MEISKLKILSLPVWQTSSRYYDVKSKLYMGDSDIEAVVAKLKSVPVSKCLGERFYVSEELFRIAVNSQAKEEKMKKYRLKKDTFLAKKGELFQEVNESGAVYFQRIKQDGSDLFTKIAKGSIINFDEWFEEVKEFSAYTPTDGERYKFLNIYGGVGNLGHLKDYQSDQFRLSIGNCYPLDTPDELIIKEQKLIPQAMHRLKMAAKKSWFEFNGSEGLNWEDGSRKYFAGCNHASGRIGVNCVRTWQDIGGVYFPTEESCQAYIDNNPEDMKLLFGVE